MSNEDAGLDRHNGWGEDAASQTNTPMSTPKPYICLHGGLTYDQLISTKKLFPTRWLPDKDPLDGAENKNTRIGAVKKILNLHEDLLRAQVEKVKTTITTVKICVAKAPGDSAFGIFPNEVIDIVANAL